MTQDRSQRRKPSRFSPFFRFIRHVNEVISFVPQDLCTHSQSLVCCCMKMPIVLRSLGCSSYAISTSFVPARRVPFSIRKGLQTLQKQPTSFSSSDLAVSSKWQQQTRLASSDQKAEDLNQQGVDNEMSEFDDAVDAEKEKQARTPWHREGADKSPVSRPRSASAMTKGRFLVYFVERKLKA
jgi:hypothetical protein